MNKYYTTYSTGKIEEHNKHEWEASKTDPYAVMWTEEINELELKENNE